MCFGIAFDIHCLGKRHFYKGVEVVITAYSEIFSCLILLNENLHSAIFLSHFDEINISHIQRQTIHVKKEDL